jgi:hypothetical protein
VKTSPQQVDLVDGECSDISHLNTKTSGKSTTVIYQARGCCTSVCNVLRLIGGAENFPVLMERYWKF